MVALLEAWRVKFGFMQMKLRCLLTVIVVGASLLGWPQMSKGQNSGSVTTSKKSNEDKQPDPVRVIIQEPVPTIHTQAVATTDALEPKEQPLPRFERPEWVIVYITGFYVLIAWFTLRAIKRQADLMEQQAAEARRSATQQMGDMQASISEATRASKAMEGIAESMALNVKSVKESVDISRDIADMQKLATELHSRAYLSAVFSTARFQDANHVFEAQAVLRNHGNTPAYDVVFRAAAQIVPVPLPEDFPFPLPEDTAGTSVSLIAPGTTKFMNRRVSDRVPDDQVDAIKQGGPPQCLAMWGIVTYQDAFKKSRRTKFAFFVNWIAWIEGMDKDKDGNPLPPQIMSFDTAHHNEAD